MVVRELCLFRLAIRWLRNHPWSFVVQDIDKIAIVLNPLDYSGELCTTGGAAGSDQSQTTSLSFDVPPRVDRTTVSAMIARSPVTFILLDLAGSGHGIYSEGFRLSRLANVDHRDALEV